MTSNHTQNCGYLVIMLRRHMPHYGMITCVRYCPQRTRSGPWMAFDLKLREKLCQTGSTHRCDRYNRYVLRTRREMVVYFNGDLLQTRPNIDVYFNGDLLQTKPNIVYFNGDSLQTRPNIDVYFNGDLLQTGPNIDVYFNGDLLQTRPKIVISMATYCKQGIAICLLFGVKLCSTRQKKQL